MRQKRLVSAVFETGVLPRYGLKTFASAVGTHCCGTTARKTLNRRIVPQMACCARGRVRRKGCVSRAWGAVRRALRGTYGDELSAAVARHGEMVREGVGGFRRRDDITDALRDDRLSQAKTKGLALLSQNRHGLISESSEWIDFLGNPAPPIRLLCQSWFNRAKRFPARKALLAPSRIAPTTARMNSST